MGDDAVFVTRAQTLAAQLLVRLDKAEGIETSAGVKKVAAAGIKAGVTLGPPRKRKKPLLPSMPKDFKAFSHNPRVGR